jgi:hypothetical protein
VLALVDYLGSAACRELIASLPGYRATRSGEVAAVDDVLPASPSVRGQIRTRRRKP